MADSNMNDGTSFRQTDLPILCASGCGFFGTAATMNMCSKCYRDHRMKEEQAASAKAAVEKSLAPSSPSPVTLVVSGKGKDVAQSSSSEPMVVEEEAAMTAAASPAMVKPKNRCGCCNKKVGVVGFTCRCGYTFCGSHRYPEEHNCTFDYKEAGKEALTKANPVVKADKLDYRL